MRIGIIGGSGFYQMEGLTDIEKTEIETPFGKPSDALILGNLDGKPGCFPAATRYRSSAASV